MKTTRRSFFKLLAAGTAVAIVAPKLLIPEEEKKLPEFRTYTMPNGTKVTIAHNPMFDDPPTLGYKTERGVFWIHFNEWEAMQKYQLEQEEKLKEFMYNQYKKK